MSTPDPIGTAIEGAAAFVTGGRRGLGRALVDELLHRGASKVYAASRSPQAQRDERIVPLVLDVTDDHSVSEAAQAAPDVSIVVNNAGVLLNTPVLKARLAEMHAELETNLFGVIRVARAFAPVLAGHRPSAMVNGALEEQGTTLTALHVGYMDTDMVAGVDAPKADPREIARQVADGILAGASEVIADDFSRAVKSHLSQDANVAYDRLARAVLARPNPQDVSRWELARTHVQPH